MASTNIRVAVRVRPFNEREIQMGAKLCIKMEDQTTTIVHENGTEKSFAFDHSYWSHDGFIRLENGYCEAENPRYATQRKVFDDLGQDILNSTFEGYNSCLFAYGQTGSGKSYSVVGGPGNKGIIPIICDELFKRMDTNQDPNVTYQVSLSMMEIYNEKLRDLLNPEVKDLKIISSGEAVQIMGLKPVPVQTYTEISAKMDQGTLNRTIHATNMNKTSSRAHTVVTITFATKRKDPEAKTVSTLEAKMNLVDLAGSERASSTGAEGDRLKEGSAINSSLSALGLVITKLVEKSKGNAKVVIPYRDSVLTQILRDALGGNSRTLMICALSPADVNYDETLSTLRYANNAKQIKNTVRKNENPTAKLVESLKKENERMKALIEAGGMLSDEERKKYNEEKANIERVISEMQQTYEQRLQELSKMKSSSESSDGPVSIAAAYNSHKPRLVNLHEDPVMSESLVYIIKSGVTIVGQNVSDCPQGISMQGLSIKPKHAQITCEETDASPVTSSSSSSSSSNGCVKIRALEPSTKLFVNGDLVSHNEASAVELKNGDRVMFGNNFMFRFELPEDQKVSAGAVPGHPFTWQMAMAEYQEKQGSRLAMLQSAAKELESKTVSSASEKGLEGLKHTLLTKEEDRLAREEAEVMRHPAYTAEDRERKLKEVRDAHARRLVDIESVIKEEEQKGMRAMTEQLRLRRNMKSLEDKVNNLGPMIEEANSLALEMGKDLQFVLKLKKKRTYGGRQADNSIAAKSFEIMVLVVSGADAKYKSGAVPNDKILWTWATDKFEARLFVMRELYTEFLENGPTLIPKEKDPFWDAPTPVEIGWAMVPLLPLTQLVDIDGSYPVKDIYDSRDIGALLDLKIVPENLDGSEVEYLNDGESLIGKSFALPIVVVSVTKLPPHFSSVCTVSFELLGHKIEAEASNISRETVAEYIKIVNADQSVVDVFNDQITVIIKATLAPHLREQLFSSARPLSTRFASPSSSSSSAYGRGSVINRLPTSTTSSSSSSSATLPPLYPQSNESKSYVPPPSTASSSSFSSMASAPSTPSTTSAAPALARKCDQCNEQEASKFCGQCGKNFCERCLGLMHRAASRRDHTFSALPPIRSSASSSASSSSSLFSPALSTSSSSGPPIVPFSPTSGEAQRCNQCNEQIASIACPACARIYCERCSNLMHKAPSRRDHQRVDITLLLTDMSASRFAPPTPVAAKSPTPTPTSPPAPAPVPTASAPGGAAGGLTKCAHCAERDAAFTCVECSKLYCVNCEQLFHKAPSRRTHTRTPL